MDDVAAAIMTPNFRQHPDDIARILAFYLPGRCFVFRCRVARAIKNMCFYICINIILLYCEMENNKLETGLLGFLCRRNRINYIVHGRFTNF